MNDINQMIERIIALHDNGGNPANMMQTMMSRHPNIQQIGMQLNNMKQGRTNSEFYLQMARQAGVNEQNIQGLTRILGLKK